MTKKVIYVLLALSISVLGLSCRKKKVDDNIKKQKEKQRELEAHDVKTIELEVTKFGAWLWINFEKGVAVNAGMTVDQAVESDAWDLGVSRVYFKTNGGKSGKGKGAAFHTDPEKLQGDESVRIGKERTDKINLWEYKVRPSASDWVEDIEEFYHSKNKEKGAPMGEYGTFTKTGLNMALSTSYKNPQQFLDGYNQLGLAAFKPGMSMPPKIIVDESIFFVRCANGKVAMCRLRNGQEAPGQTNSFSSIKYKLDYIYPVE